MAHLLEYQDITGAWYDLMHRALWAPDSFVDFHIKGRSIVISDTIVSCQNSSLNLDLSITGCTLLRWQRFLRTYFEPDTISGWLEQCKTQPPGAENFLPANPAHHWGGCFLGLSYRRSPHPRLALYSRVCILPMPGSLELALSSLLGARLGHPPFTWFAANIQWEDMKLLPYLVHTGQLDSFIASGTFLGRQVGVNYRGAFTHHKRAGRIRTVQNALKVRDLPSLSVNSLPLCTPH